MLSPATRARAPPPTAYPGLADSTLGYMLSPAARARAPPLTAYPGLADSTLGYMLSPATRARAPPLTVYPGLADSPWATCCRPLRGLALLRLLRTQGSRTRPGLYAVARYAGSR